MKFTYLNKQVGEDCIHVAVFSIELKKAKSELEFHTEYPYNLFTFSDKKLADFRNKNIGFIFQFHQLLPEFTAIENVMIPALISGMTKREAEEKAMELLSFLNIQSMAEKKPDTMSGGENQRVAVARALINRPQIVLADEPSGNLDSENAHELQNLFLRLRDEFKQAFVIVTHNEELANIADRKLLIRHGRINT